MSALAHAGALVAWRNKMQEEADRLDRLGPAVRACRAAAVPVPSLGGIRLLGVGSPAEVVEETEQAACAVVEPSRKRRRVATPEVDGGPSVAVVGESACFVDERRLRALAQAPQRTEAVPRADPWPVRRPRLRAVGAADCPSGVPERVVEAGEVPALLSAAVGRRIAAEPDRLLDVLRCAPRGGQMAPAELLNRLRLVEEPAEAGPAGIEDGRLSGSSESGSREGVRGGPATGGAEAPGPGSRMAGSDRLPSGWADTAPEVERRGPELGSSGGRARAGRRGRADAAGERSESGRSGGLSEQPRSGWSGESDGPGGLPGSSGLAGLSEPGQPSEPSEPIGSGQSVGSGRSAGSGWPGESGRSGWPGEPDRSAESDEVGRAGGPGGWDDSDVERVLERVLGDAARRYGIEV
ncbi:hypothetical protein OHA70_10460 [Kribbella sp. NBC_00382]|uniref:hypothetical protein n=1 Tax=Kribbella sp. NBC_00382 TaxID=2975967 RepID=UPI002E20120D